MLVTIFLVYLLGLATAGNRKCHAIVFEGGGDRGAYEVGVLKGLIDNLPPAEVEWDVVTGVSIGAMNAALLSKFPTGQEPAMIDYGLKIWRSLTRDTIVSNWTWGMAEGLFWRKGLMNNAPAFEFVKKEMTGVTPQRKLMYSAADMNTGTFVRFTEAMASKPIDDFAASIISSSAMPVVFPHVDYDGKTLVDGGTLINLDIGGAVSRCLEVVDNHSDVIMDVILAEGRTYWPIDASHDKTNVTVQRIRALQSYKLAIDDLVYETQDFPEVNFRYVIGPSQALPEGMDELNFDPKVIEFMIDLGQTDAINAINNNEVFDLAKWKQKTKELRTPRYRVQKKNASTLTSSV